MQLHPALSFCRLEDQFLFLDLAADRYFALGTELAKAFASLLAGTATNETRDALLERGVLVPSGGLPIEPCPARVPQTSLLDGTPPRPSHLQVARLAWRFAQTRRSLRRRGLANVAAKLTAARNASSRHPDGLQLGLGAAAYERLVLYRGAHDLCLPHSLALARYLADRGVAAEVVLGVQLRPFSAHCWVECEDRLVNDRLDRVRLYTPIRRL